MGYLITKTFNEENDIKYNKDGYFVKNKGFFFKKSKVTVITPVYNAELFLAKTIDSVINQTIQFDNIEYILVDDKSTDSSRDILWEYAKKHKNIIAVFLKDNSGTPATPRNLGIELANSDYITFLDADDWLEKDGLKALYDILLETDDDYAVGRTIKETSKGNKIVGEHQSALERRSVSPYLIPHMFHHLAPTARMMKRNMLIENNIRFPEMKFAEDKQFFIDVLTLSQSVSTTKKVIYYANRLDENKGSLTTRTNVLEKIDTNIEVIKYVKNKKLPLEQEKIILNRLYEYDCITRLFNRNHFIISKDKKDYFMKFSEVLDTSKDLSYDISENFFHPINKVIYQMFKQGEYKNIEDLISWNKKEKFKKYIIKDNLPYMIAPFPKGEFEHIRIPMLAIHKNGYFKENIYKLEIQVFGDFVEKINDFVFRNRSDVNEESSFGMTFNNIGEGSLTIDIESLNTLSSSSYEIFIRFCEYEKINIIKQELVQFENRIFNFYTTVNSNSSLKITNS